MAELLDDPYDAVRFIAHRSLKSVSGFSGFEFDFMSPQQDRAAAVRSVLYIWQRRSKTKPPANPAEVLLDAAGNLQRSEFERLLKQRDTRDVNLGE